MNEIYKAAFIIDTMHKIKTGEITKKAELDKVAIPWLPLLLGALGGGTGYKFLVEPDIRKKERKAGQKELLAALAPLIKALGAPGGNLTKIPANQVPIDMLESYGYA